LLQNLLALSLSLSQALHCAKFFRFSGHDVESFTKEVAGCLDGMARLARGLKQACASFESKESKQGLFLRMGKIANEKLVLANTLEK